MCDLSTVILRDLGSTDGLMGHASGSRTFLTAEKNLIFQQSRRVMSSEVSPCHPQLPSRWEIACSFGTQASDYGYLGECDPVAYLGFHKLLGFPSGVFRIP